MTGRVLRLAGLLLLALASVSLLLGALEIGFRVAGYQPIYAVYSKPSVLWQRDPLLGWSHEPGASEVFVGPRPYPIEYRTPVHINSLGLRGPEIAPLPSGGYRVLLLGDSTVAGFEVPYEATFGAVAEAELARRLDFPVQVINAGVRGYGTDQSLLYYRERGRALAPDLVVLTHANNDPGDNVTLHRMRRIFGKAAFALHGDGSLELVGHPIPDYPLCSWRSLDASYRPRNRDTLAMRSVCRLQLLLFDRSAFFTFLSLRIQRSPELMRRLYDLGGARWETARARGPLRAAGLFLGAAPAWAAEPPAPPHGSGVRYDYALTTALVIELDRLVRGDGAQFVLLVGRDELPRLDDALLAAHAVELLVPRPRSPLVDPRIYHFENDPHFNEQGHRLLARELVRRIERHARAVRDAGPAEE